MERPSIAKNKWHGPIPEKPFEKTVVCVYVLFMRGDFFVYHVRLTSG